MSSTSRLQVPHVSVNNLNTQGPSVHSGTDSPVTPELSGSAILQDIQRFTPSKSRPRDSLPRVTPSRARASTDVTENIPTGPNDIGFDPLGPQTNGTHKSSSHDSGSRPHLNVLKNHGSTGNDSTVNSRASRLSARSFVKSATYSAERITDTMTSSQIWQEGGSRKSFDEDASTVGSLGR